MNFKSCFIASAFVFLNLFSAAAPAQTQNTASIDSELAQAERDLQKVQSLIEANASHSGGASNWLCDMQVLKLQRTYIEWFKQNAPVLNAAEKAYGAAVKNVQIKINQLKKETITPVAERGSTAKDLQIGYDEIIAYLRQLNGRAKTCKKDQFEMLLQEQRDPTSNSLLVQGKRIHVGHDQILAVLSRMTDSLNVSLRESTNQYGVALRREECGYDLVVHAVIQVPPFEAKQLDISLLQNGGLSATGAKERDLRLIQTQKIGEYSASGNLRYLQMHAAKVGASCALPKWAAIDPQALPASSQAYVPFDAVNAEVNRAYAKFKVAMASGNQAKMWKSIGLEMKPTNYCDAFSKERHQNFKGAFLNGSLLGGGGCFLSAQLVQGPDHWTLFALADGQTIYRLTQEDTSWQTLAAGALALLSSGTIQGSAAITYLSNKFTVNAVNLKLQRMERPQLRIPPANFTSKSPLHLTRKKSTTCDQYSGANSGPKYTEILVDGADLAYPFCVSEARAIRVYGQDILVALGSDLNVYVAKKDGASWMPITGTKDISSLGQIAMDGDRLTVTVKTGLKETRRYSFSGDGVDLGAR